MKLFEVASLNLRVDNPGGDWLEDKRSYADEGGLNEFGAPKRFGTITGVWNRDVLIPVDFLAKVSGGRGEQTNVREDDLNSLIEYMKENNKLPPLQSPDSQYTPYIEVYQDGSAWVNEGNHRIMAAKILDWKYLPVTLRYFNGAEGEDGPITPEKVKAYDAKAIAEGYSPLNDFKGVL